MCFILTVSTTDPNIDWAYVFKAIGGVGVLLGIYHKWLIKPHVRTFRLIISQEISDMAKAVHEKVNNQFIENDSKFSEKLTRVYTTIQSEDNEVKDKLSSIENDITDIKISLSAIKASLESSSKPP